MRSRGVKKKKKKKSRLPPNWVPGKGLGPLQPKRNQRIRSSLGWPEPSGWREEDGPGGGEDIWQLG